MKDGRCASVAYQAASFGARAPGGLFEAIVQIAQRTADRDLTDVDRRAGVGFDLALQACERGLGLEREGIDQRLQRKRAFAFVAPQDQHVQQPVAQRQLLQGLPARIAGGEQRAVEARIQVLADDRRIEQHLAIVQHQGGDLGQRVVGHDGRIGLEHRRHRALQLQRLDAAQLMGHHHHLAHERRLGRPVQFHQITPLARRAWMSLSV